MLNFHKRHFYVYGLFFMNMHGVFVTGGPSSLFISVLMNKSQKGL